MKICSKCKKEYKDEYEYCPKCGKPYNEKNKRVKTPGYIAINFKFRRIIMVVGLIILFWVMIIFLLASCASHIVVTKDDDNKNKSTNTSTAASKSTNQNTSNEKNTNKELRQNIETALESIGYDKTKIKNITDAPDWSNGPRYKVIYGNETLIVYAFDNNDIASIRDTSLNFLYENKEVTGVNQNNIKENETALIDGQLGEYGKKDIYDSEEYIRYYVPAGTYTVKALTRHAQFYIEKQAIYTNDFGYQESKIVKNITMGDVNSTETVVVGEDECISLTAGASISIKKNK